MPRRPLFRYRSPSRTSSSCVRVRPWAATGDVLSARTSSVTVAFLSGKPWARLRVFISLEASLFEFFRTQQTMAFEDRKDDQLHAIESIDDSVRSFDDLSDLRSIEFGHDPSRKRNDRRRFGTRDQARDPSPRGVWIVGRDVRENLVEPKQRLARPDDLHS